MESSFLTRQLEKSFSMMQQIQQKMMHKDLLNFINQDVLYLTNWIKSKGSQEIEKILDWATFTYGLETLQNNIARLLEYAQADATGEGKRWLTMDNVASAKTTKQAEADWIIGIGKTHNENEEYFRYLSICKNKLLGDEDTDPILRHGHLTVKINPYIARYED